MKKVYRVLAQKRGEDGKPLNIDGLRMASSTEQAHELAIDLVGTSTSSLPYHLTELCTEEQYDGCQILFCPRCGAYIGHDMGAEDPEVINNDDHFECEECDASGTIYIRENEDDDDDDEDEDRDDDSDGEE